MTQSLKKALVFVTVLFALSALLFATPTTYNVGGIALNGYDPVSYAKELKAVLGKPEYSLSAGPITWRFSTQANLNLFAKDPSKYTPQYGGWCAVGISQGNKIAPNPTNWYSVFGKTYLFNSAGSRATFQSSLSNTLLLADQKWPTLN